jgi:hypothetical protein
MPNTKTKLASKAKTTPAKVARKTTLKKPSSVKTQAALGLKLTSAPGSDRRAPLPPAYKILIKSLDILKRNWEIFGWILGIYALLNFFLVHGLSDGLNVATIKNSIKGSFHGAGGRILSASSVFVYFIGYTAAASGGSGGSSAGVYQTIMLIVTTLALIWILRQLYNATAVRVSDAYYRGMYPFIQFFLVLLYIAVELLPFLIGAVVFSIVIAGGIAAPGIEVVLSGILFAALTLVTLYWLGSSLFALYIVTLPDMTPLKAIRSARELVKSRRWLVIRKVLFLPLVLLGGLGIITMPFLLGVPSLAGWVFFLLSIAALAIINSYMYALYRELIG